MSNQRTPALRKSHGTVKISPFQVHDDQGSFESSGRNQSRDNRTEHDRSKVQRQSRRRHFDDVVDRRDRRDRHDRDRRGSNVDRRYRSTSRYDRDRSSYRSSRDISKRDKVDLRVKLHRGRRNERERNGFSIQIVKNFYTMILKFFSIIMWLKEQQ